jgi:uncharacterized protein YydD (DUF2326 family)
MLHAVRANHPSFRDVEFGPGLNIVLADRTRESDPKDTRNGLGKSTLLEIIHFCLGAEVPDGLKTPLLREWTFSLELDVGSCRLTVSRSIATPSRVSIEGDVGSLVGQPPPLLDSTRQLRARDWTAALGARMFGLTDEEQALKHGPSFRALISFFVRRGREAYLSPFKHHGAQAEVAKQVLNAFLLRLGWRYALDWKSLQDQDRLLKDLKRAAQSGLMGRLMGSRGELEAVVARLERQASTQQQRLADFRVHEHYRDVQVEADALTQDLHGLANQNFIDGRTLTLYGRALEEEEGPEPHVVAKLFEQAGTALPTMVRRRLDEVEAFHGALLDNRRGFLGSEIDRLRAGILGREREIEEKGARRTALLHVLSTHGALQEYTELQALLVQTQAGLQEARQRIRNLGEWEQKGSQLKVDRELLLQSMTRDYAEREPQRREAMALFNANSDALYKSPGNLLIDIAQKAGYRFGVRIERTGSHGIESMKVYCYDLMLAQLWAQRPTSPGFLIHDSTLFDGVDERQRALALELAHRESTTRGFQYICTLNSDAVPLDEFSPGFAIDQFVRLRLTDATPEGCLLGIRF